MKLKLMNKNILPLCTGLILLLETVSFTSFAQKTLAGGDIHSVFACYDQTVKSCGNNLFGMLGDGTNTTRTLPVSVGSLSSVPTPSCP